MPPKKTLFGKWVPDTASKVCLQCQAKFSFFKRRHHCRRCGDLVCAACSKVRKSIKELDSKKQLRVCLLCALTEKEDGNESFCSNRSRSVSQFSHHYNTTTQSNCGDDPVDDRMTASSNAAAETTTTTVTESVAATDTTAATEGATSEPAKDAPMETTSSAEKKKKRASTASSPALVQTRSLGSTMTFCEECGNHIRMCECHDNEKHQDKLATTTSGKIERCDSDATTEEGQLDRVEEDFESEDEIEAVDNAEVADPEAAKSVKHVHHAAMKMRSIYENQRWYPVKGWSSSLMPTDRPNWSSKDGKVAASKDDKPPAGWKWATDWTVYGTNPSDDNWEYAVDFPVKDYVHEKSTLHCVRRRCWHRKLVELHPDEETEAQASTDLNAVAAEMKKQLTQQDSVASVTTTDRQKSESITTSESDPRCVYENQRWYPVKGWSSTLMPTDRPNWSSKDGKLALTKTDSPPSGWKWASEWALYGGNSSDGNWEYAVDFPVKDYTPEKSAMHCVRRRCWQRQVARVSSEAEITSNVVANVKPETKDEGGNHCTQQESAVGVDAATSKEDKEEVSAEVSKTQGVEETAREKKETSPRKLSAAVSQLEVGSNEASPTSKETSSTSDNKGSGSLERNESVASVDSSSIKNRNRDSSVASLAMAQLIKQETMGDKIGTTLSKGAQDYVAGGTWMLKPRSKDQSANFLKSAFRGIGGDKWNERWVIIKGDALCYGPSKDKIEKSIPLGEVKSVSVASRRMMLSESCPEDVAAFGFRFTYKNTEVAFACKEDHARNMFLEFLEHRAKPTGDDFEDVA